MASRLFHQAVTQGLEHVDLNFQLLPNGASAPTLGEGDSAGAYVTALTHVSTGKWSFTTVDPYVACVLYFATANLNTPPTTAVTQFITYVRNASGTYTFTLWYMVAGTLTDIAQALPSNASGGNGGNAWCVALTMRNSISLP